MALNVRELPCTVCTHVHIRARADRAARPQTTKKWNGFLAARAPIGLQSRSVRPQCPISGAQCECLMRLNGLCRVCRLSVPKPCGGLEGLCPSCICRRFLGRSKQASSLSLKVLLARSIQLFFGPFDPISFVHNPLIFEMPVPSSSKLRPGYSLNFRHTAAPAADEAAARFPGFTLHIGLGEWNHFSPLDCTIPNVTIVLTKRQRASFFTSCSYFSPQREYPISPST